VLVAWRLGGFPSPDGVGETLFLVGIAVGLAAELGVSTACAAPNPTIEDVATDCCEYALRRRVTS
jgi:hypothetical protein